ncbi:MAG: integration host factor subunit beta [Desulfobacterales bacterium]|nr:MAG: integration host factor subunit beta [Desulfobacterales bacterium]
MNKLQLVEALREESGLNKSEALAVVNVFFDEISNALAKGDRVEIRGLCSFYVKKYKEYVGRNPKTGESVKVSPKKLPFFKCGQELKERVDY